MKSIFKFTLVIILISNSCQSQNDQLVLTNIASFRKADKVHIAKGFDKYEAINFLSFQQDKNTYDEGENVYNEGLLLTIGKYNSTEGLLFLEKPNLGPLARENKLHLFGDLEIILKNIKVLKIKDTGIYGFNPRYNQSSILYILTQEQMNELLKSPIMKLNYALKSTYTNEILHFEGKNISPNPDHRVELLTIYKENS